MSLEKEIRMIEDYMALEKIRYGDNMQMSLEIQGRYKDKMIAPLLFIPFIENSFKHGASKMITHPWVTVHIKIDSNRLYFIIKNSKPPIIEPVTTKVNIGLNNVKKRLELLYPGMHKLSIISDPNSYTIDLDLQLHDIRQNPSILTELKTEKEYAMA
jgi:LytS/YehU family sensor histidine kinase